MNDHALGYFLLVLSFLFSLSYAVSGFLEKVRIPGILAALFVAMGIRYTFVGDFLNSGVNGEIFSFLAVLGVLFLLFFIGLEVDVSRMKKQSKNIVLATFLNTLFPFLFGMSVMLYLGYGKLLSFVVGITCMPTAEAVIVPILDEFKLIKSRVGEYIIGAGVLDDVIEVFLVAFVSVWIGMRGEVSGDYGGKIFIEFFYAVLFVCVVFLLKRYILPFLSEIGERKVSNSMVLMVATLFAVGGFAAYFDLGVVVGAIMAGIAVRGVLKGDLGERAEDAVRVISYGFFGVLFFLWIGMSVDLKGLFNEPLLAVLIFLAAFFGKMFGILIMVPLKKISLKEALTIGVGLNARLTTGIIVAKLLFEASLIDVRLFTALVASASVSTIAVPFIFSFIAGRWREEFVKGEQYGL